MTRVTINSQQAHNFALAIVSDISAYIEQHRAEYLAYLAATGQADERYQCKSEAAEYTEDEAE